ncbi:MAG: hypothetical protein OXC39_02880 [Candidatus Dadabacteria bacterium]|nr:hypothetical protein [Candidatus Dadabacteria bacterium]
MNRIVPRTCTEMPPPGSDSGRGKSSKPLEQFRPVAAYVLLGGPGSGKTTAFRTESEALGDNAFYVSARDFLCLDPQNHPEWSGKTLFIDGLDEIRAGARDVRSSLDEIRRHIDYLGRPRFRISCRDADWLGRNDWKHLASVSEDSSVTLLRIDPLTDSDAVSILCGRFTVAKARRFIASAKERGIEALLGNPQGLNLLAAVVAEDGIWPGSRFETFEKACSQMVRERNEEHWIATRRHCASRILDAAGCLCAVSLICGTAGLAWSSDFENEDYPGLDRYVCYDRGELEAALSTKLFEAGPGNRRFVPVHRHIEEFLAARYLSRLVDQGVPFRRILALIAGEQEIAVIGMGGLCAWLAVHREDFRSDLIRHNPVGVFLYGDTSTFSGDENMKLLESLCRKRDSTDSFVRRLVGYRAVVTPRMEVAFREALNSPRCDPKHQKLTEFLLDILRWYELAADFSGILLEIIRDGTRYPYIRKLALDVFIHGQPEDWEDSGDLKALLDDIRDGRVPDPEYELLGTLLLDLYPRQLPPSEVWDYFSCAAGRESEGAYWQFWQCAFSDRFLSSRETGELDLNELEVEELEVEELLDSLQRRIPGLRTAFEAWLLNDLPRRLLACGLHMHGEQADRKRLYDWLTVGLSGSAEHDEYCLGPVSQIRTWLERRPETQKAVFEEGLERWRGSGDFASYATGMRERLYGASPPPDFGAWCLEKALAFGESEPQVSRFLLEQAVFACRYQNGDEGLSMEILREKTGSQKSLSDALEKLLVKQELRGEAPGRSGIRNYRGKEEDKDRKWIEQVHASKEVLRGNHARPGLLREIAEIYFGDFYSWRDYYGPENIRKSLPGHPDLADAALSGLRGTVDREDVPDADEIFRMLDEGEVYSIGLPFLAGLAEAERTVPLDVSQWSEARIRKSLLFYYISGADNYEPRWYLWLLETHPEIVGDMQARFALSGFRSGREDIPRLRELASENSHARIACIASLGLLRSFPSQCGLKHLRNIDYLLWAALKHADREELANLVGRKLDLKSLNVAQRARWLATGLIVRPDEYKDRLGEFTRGHEIRVRHLATFLTLGNSRSFLLSELGVPELELLIRLMGTYFEPRLSRKPGIFTPEDRFSGLVYDFIEAIADKDEDAGDALERLYADSRLKGCHFVLSRMLDAKRAVRNDYDYRHPDIAQVCRTFANDAPANASDLAALVEDRLSEIAERSRTDNADDWRRYWNEDSHGQPLDPKHENSCRDVLLSDLRQLLPEGVSAQPEWQHVNDRRSDIEVSYGDFRVPIEIKKNENTDLLSSIRDQLVSLYTKDPATQGHGIYLVLWFGKDRTKPLPSGVRPDSSQELREAVEAVLSEDESRKISVCVIDVSPGG